MSDTPPLHLFQGFGVELEYMIVNRDTLDVLPVADELLKAISGDYRPEVELGELAWSNELVLHVIELKTNGPATLLEHLPHLFQENVRHINRLLEPQNGLLMPGAMHPWMDPQRETRLWPHDYNEVYESYNRIFGCSGHGWSNLQSTHLNLPFATDEEFGRLHAAIRLALPILPALAASSPLVERQFNGVLDRRLDFYRYNQRHIPQIAGKIIPEPVFTPMDYQNRILQKTYRKIAPYDPQGILQFEWLNSRGAIARFERGAIEIRILDIQECPAADLAIAAAVIALIKALVEEKWSSYAQQKRRGTSALASILYNCIENAEQTVIEDPAYLSLFDYPGSRCSAGELWQYLIEAVLPAQSPGNKVWRHTLDLILQHGTLARRLLKATGDNPSPQWLREVYRELCTCLQEGRLFNHETS